VSAVAFAAAACGSGGGTPKGAPTPPSPGKATIRIEGFRFLPKTLRAAAGTTVKWTKVDRVEHTVTSGAPGKKSEMFERRIRVAGAAFSFTFERRGTYPYFCDIHQFMRGEVVVA
jgi:plastocyanin